MELNSLIELAYILSQQNEFKEILRVVSQKTANLLHAELVLILMVNPRTHQTVKTIHREGSEISPSKYRSLQNQISGWIMKNCEPLLSPDVKLDPRFRRVHFGDLSIKSVMGVPLRIEGNIIGTLILINKNQRDEFSEDELSFLEQIAIISAPYLRNVQQLQQYFELPLSGSGLRGKYEKLGLLGKSKKFIELLQSIEAAARCDVRVLLEGQSGTGKELVAQTIHKTSARGSGPFVAVDCGAIPANLMESELFGHVKGAFTGATHERKGLFIKANHGTLFMDEITNLPLEMQSTLLRVLQEGEIRPVGSDVSCKVDVRVISAASVSLREMVDKEQFREDLFYRLYVYPISVPSLADRREDIPMLANHFLKRFTNEQNKKAESFHYEILDFMKNRDWPGHIRELENFVERLVTIASPKLSILDHTILPEELKKEFKKAQAVPDNHYVVKSLNESLAEYEEQLIRQALVKYNWNQAKAARALKIPAQTMGHKMRKLGIKKPG